MDKQNYIGLELARKLFEAKAEQPCNYVWVSYKYVEWNKYQTELMKIKKYWKQQKDSSFEVKWCYPAYSYYDIIVTHAEKFFGSDFDQLRTPTLCVLRELQAKRKNNNDVDEIIWKYCKFNPENKEEG